MNTDSNSPCELILKIGCNECDEISTAIASLLRSCSIQDENFVSIERQIQSTTYFGSFTTQSSILKTPIECQSLSCVIFLTDKLFSEQEKNEFLKSTHLWNFHHKIELLNEYRQTIARQDYYELSQFLPLWSISHIPYNKQILVRFNVFTKHFDTMLIFYQHLFQRQPDSRKSGFVLFNLSSTRNSNLLYQFSIKYSPSIQSYTISQSAYLKFRLRNLNHFLHEYTRKLFTINQFEYYIYDPDGNLLHLYLHNSSSNIKEYVSSQPILPTNDSGFGDSSSDPSVQFFHLNPPQIYPLMKNNIDDQSHSSNDSGQCSSISSNELRDKVQQHRIPSVNNISVRSAKKSEMDYRLKQQEKTVFPHISRQLSLYESEPRLSNMITPTNRYYSSMNNVPPTRRLNHFKSSAMKNSMTDNHDISYEVDSPRQTSSSTYGYLNAFLLKKHQAQNVEQMITEFEKPNIQNLTLRPKSAPLTDSFVSRTSKSTKNLLQRSVRGTIRSKHNEFSQLRSKSATFGWQNPTPDITSTDDETINTRIDRTPSNSRINIGITLDSRLRRTPVLDMLRSTKMESQQLNQTHSFLPIARF